jgi:hypothetical protein
MLPRRLTLSLLAFFFAVTPLAVMSIACGSGGGTSAASSGGGGSYNNLDPTTLPPGVNVPAQATVSRNEQTNTPWQICVGTCANAAIPQTYTLTQNVASPSLNNDGQTSSYFQSGTPYGDALWYYHVGDSSATNFVIDLYIMIDNPQNVEALEFAVLKNDGLNWYKTSTQCNYQSGQLRGFDVQTFQWVNLGASCVQAQANTWQRITLQYSISGGQTNFNGVSFDGVLQPISVSLPPETQTTSSELLGIHVQLDNANTTAGYTLYVDDWSLYSW